MFSRRLLTSALVLLITLLGGTAAVLAGVRQTTPSAAMWAMLGFDACALPCYAGLMLGETPFSEVSGRLSAALAALDEQILVSGSQVVFFIDADFAAERIGGTVSYEGGRVGNISLSVALPVADLLLRFGTPDCTIITPLFGSSRIVVALYWTYGETLLTGVLLTPDDRLTLHQPIYAITLTHDDAPPACQRPEAGRWRGFGRLRGSPTE